MNLRTLLLIGFIIIGLQSEAQTKWTLAKCIQYAQQNNLTVMQSELNVQDAVLINKAAIQSRYPSLNASTGGGFQFGRRINPVTNAFESQSIGYNSLNLNAGVTLYNGQKIKNQIAQSKLDIKAAEADLGQTTQDIALDVAVAYLSILLAEDQLENANKRLELSFTQLDQTDKLIKAGSRPAADLQDIKAQVAQDEQIVVARENDVAIAYLNLQQLLQLDSEKPMNIDRPEIEVPEQEDTELSVNKIYNRALTTQPGVLASEMRVQSAAMAIDIANADRLPRLVLFGDLGTNYSTKVPDPNDVDESNAMSVLQDPIPAEINGTPGSLAFYSIEGIVTGTRGYFGQLSDNFGQSVGLNLSIPIYNQGQFKTNIQRSEIALKDSEIREQLVKQQLKQDIQRAIADAKAGFKNYEAARKTEMALETAYGNTEKKFKLGASNTLEYTTAKNQLDRARVDTIIAKYDYIFKLKVVDFYQGKKIQL